MLTTVVLIVVMLLLSAFFSGMEIAFTSKNRLKLEIDRKQNRMFDQIAEVFARHPGQYITTILVGNNIALVVYSLSMSLLLRSIYASLGWEQLARSGSVAVDTAVSTVIIIFFAEFLPKSIFRNNPNFYYRALAPVIYFFYIVLYPVARFTTLLSHGILHLLGRRVEERNITPSFDREDLAALLDSNSPEQHSEPDNELKLFQNALDFADLRVRDCMVPRVDVEAVDIDDTSIEQLTARFVDSKYSAYLRSAQVDRQHRGLRPIWKKPFTRPRQIADVMMEVNFVPETMPLQNADAGEFYQAPFRTSPGSTNSAARRASFRSKTCWSRFSARSRRARHSGLTESRSAPTSMFSRAAWRKYPNENTTSVSRRARKHDTLACGFIFNYEGIPTAGETVFTAACNCGFSVRRLAHRTGAGEEIVVRG